MFVTLEGIDLSGKSTQARMLARALGPSTVLVREPGGTEAGERLREILMSPEVELGPRGELMLFCAARAELVRQAIRPARDAGRDVVCDRYVDSTAAYQGAAIGALLAGRDKATDERSEGVKGTGVPPLERGIEAIEALSETVVGDCMPELTIFVRVDPELAMARGRAREGSEGGEGATDRFEARGLEFQREVATAYERIVERHRERIVAVDGERPVDEVHELVMRALAERTGAAA